MNECMNEMYRSGRLAMLRLVTPARCAHPPGPGVSLMPWRDWWRRPLPFPPLTSYQTPPRLPSPAFLSPPSESSGSPNGSDLVSHWSSRMGRCHGVPGGVSSRQAAAGEPLRGGSRVASGRGDRVVVGSCEIQVTLSLRMVRGRGFFVLLSLWWVYQAVCPRILFGRTLGGTRHE